MLIAAVMVGCRGGGTMSDGAYTMKGSDITLVFIADESAKLSDYYNVSDGSVFIKVKDK